MLKGKGGKPMEWNIIVGLVCTVLGAVISYATFPAERGRMTGAMAGRSAPF